LAYLNLVCIDVPKIGIFRHTYTWNVSTHLTWTLFETSKLWIFPSTQPWHILAYLNLVFIDVPKIGIFRHTYTWNVSTHLTWTRLDMLKLHIFYAYVNLAYFGVHKTWCFSTYVGFTYFCVPELAMFRHA